MSRPDPGRWLRRAIARVPPLGLTRLPDAPLPVVRDLWPGDPAAGAALLRGERDLGGMVFHLTAASFADPDAGLPLMEAAHGFLWLRDLRALGTDAARQQARALVAAWMHTDPRQRDASKISTRPDIMASRLVAWLGHYDFFAASADDGFRQTLMQRLVADARTLSALLPAEEQDGRALTALKGAIAAGVALPEHGHLLARALRFLPQELAAQILPDGMHCERSPSMLLACLQDLLEIRSFLQSGQARVPPPLANAIERALPVLRAMRHGDGRLALFNGSREESPALIEAVLTQAGRGGRAPAILTSSGLARLAAKRSVVIADCGVPARDGLDRVAHADTLSFEMSVGRDRMIVNCGAGPVGSRAWRDVARATAAHSTLVIADTSSAELLEGGLGRRPTRVTHQHQEASGAHLLEMAHDGWRLPFRAIHRRRLFLAASGDELRGSDEIEADEPQPFAIRFHLHPSVTVSLRGDGTAALLTLPNSGGWQLYAEGARLSLEESIYLGAPGLRKSEQVVLTGYQDGPQTVKWAITRLG